MSYDVQIGKLISGRRELEGKGRYWLCKPDQTISEMTTFSPLDGIFVSRKIMEDALYDFCKQALASYIEEGRNKDVYTFSIYTDSYYGSYVIYINNHFSLNETTDDYYTRNREKYMKTGDEWYSQTRNQIYDSLKYAEGDYPFMFEHMPEQFDRYLQVFTCIEQEQPGDLRIDENYIFEKTVADSELFLIAIDVIHRLQDDLKQLDQTDDFIAYVSAADGVGGDFLTFSQLLRQCCPEGQLYRAMPDLKKKDSEYRAAVEAVHQLLFAQQVEHWVKVIEGGEFGEGSMRSFWKTYYEAYEQLMLLGERAIPYIQEFLDGDLKRETKGILLMVIEDVRFGQVSEWTGSAAVCINSNNRRNGLCGRG